ncbi:MAG: DNA replication and repair protein RecF [Bacteroidales bacterium]|nr:DNA replication and repair protein RecF [Bacteroidales bacterium]
MKALTRISVSDYRNIEFQQLEFCPGINCIWGNNGEGKTNLLDAVHYLCMVRSAVCPAEKFLARYGCGGFSICGEVSDGDGTVTKYSISTSGDKKILKCGGKAYKRFSEHIGKVPVVMVTPSDISLVSDSGEARRRFVNSVLSQMSPGYLANLQQYNRLLAQRNLILKSNYIDRVLLESNDALMGAAAQNINSEREQFTAVAGPLIRKYYSLISSNPQEYVSVAYNSDLSGGRSLEDVLRDHFDRDCVLKFTGAGVHRDDFDFLLAGEPIRRCGSQGQQKSFLVALKFAQYEIMKNSYGFPPLLLLDDIFDKLDTVRMSNLLQLATGDGFGQIFLTDCNKSRLSGIVDSMNSEKAYFECVQGRFVKINPDKSDE